MEGEGTSPMEVRLSVGSVRVRLCCAIAYTAFALCAGCAAKKKRQVEEEWKPSPRVELSNIGSFAPTLVVNGFQILPTRPAQGLFPANVAVSRVAIAPDAKDEAQTPKPQLYADPRNEFLQWNSVFDDQMAVSEVFPIDQRDLGGGEAEPGQILAAFRALHAKMALLYAVNELGPRETEMFGTLYDTASGQPIAVIHARSQSKELPEDEKNPDDPYHLWKTDSRALVRAKFAEFAHRCVRELIVTDQPAEVVAPTGWTPVGPIRPVEWPPRQHGKGGRS